MNNNKTTATVGVETTTAQAIIPPQKSEQGGLPRGIPTKNSIFAGVYKFADPLGVIKRMFSNGSNEDTPKEVSTAPVSNMNYMLILLVGYFRTY